MFQEQTLLRARPGRVGAGSAHSEHVADLEGFSEVERFSFIG